MGCRDRRTRARGRVVNGPHVIAVWATLPPCLWCRTSIRLREIADGTVVFHGTHGVSHPGTCAPRVDAFNESVTRQLSAA